MPISADLSILLAISVIVVLSFGGGEVGASAAALPTYQKVCAGLGIATMNEARAVCQAISPSYFLATPFTAVENAAVTSLLAASQTAILGGSSQTYPNAYSWEDGPRRGETFMVLFSGTAYPASNYYHAFTGTVSFGASYVLAIDSGGWKSYVPGVLGTNCVICEKRLAADVCSVVGTDVVAAGDWLSAASCTCRAGFRSRDCSLQFEAFCDGPFATMDAYNAQCTARGMYLSAPDTAEKRYQVGRSISQHMTINHLLGGSKNVATGFWSWGYGPNTNRSFFDEVTRQNVNFWYTGEAQAGATDTVMVQISGAVWYDQAALPTCYSCQMTSCDLACNTANTLSFTGTTWPSCTCNCKEGFYGATCDCPVYGCYEAGVDTMAWQSGALDSCQCICKPGYFAPYCYPTPTISIGTASVTLSTSTSPTIPLSATRMSETPTNSIQGTPTNAQTHTQSTALTVSLSATRRSTSTSLTAPHSDTQSTTDSLPPSPSASINPTMTPTHPRTLSPSQTSTSLPTLSPAATNTPSHHQQSSTATHSRSYVPLPTATGSLTQQQQHDILRTNTSSLTKALSSSRTPPLAPVVVLPVAQRPKCPTTSLAWSVNTNGTLMPISLLTDKMIRGGGVVVNITLASPSITFIRAVNVITFGVKSVGVSDPRSFPSSVDLTAITCAFDRGSFRSILCEFPPSPSYKLRTAEALSVRIAVDGTSMGACTGDGSGSTATWEAGTKTVVPAEADTLLESLQAAFAVAASVTTAIIIVFADGSPIETQVLVMIMDSPCSSNTDRASVEWIRYIVMPFYNGGSSWMMGGNILITTIVILLHSLALFIFYHIRRRRLYKDKRKENKKSKKRIPTVLTSAAKNNLLRKCCTTMMYPGVSVTIAQVMYAGVAYGTMGILRTESGVPALLAVVGIMYLLFIPAAVLFILRRIAQVVYHLYKWEEEGVPASRAWLYPHGFWTPREQMYRLQGALGPYRLGKHYIVFFPFILALVSAVLLNVLAAHAPCDYLFVVMGIVCLMCGITTAIANPFRSVVQSFLTCVCLVALGLIAILQIIAMRTGLEVIVTLKGVASYILIISLAIRTAHSVFVFVIEYKYKDEAIEQLKEMGEQVSEVDEGPNEADIAEEEELIAVADAESKAVVPVEDQYPIDGAARDRNKSVSSRKSVSSDLISGLGGGRLSFIGMMGDSIEEEILGSQVRRGGGSSSGFAENTHQQTNAYFSGVFKKEGSGSYYLRSQDSTVGGNLDDAAEMTSDKAALPLRLSTFSRHNTQTLLSEDSATLGGGERLTPRANDYLLQSPRSHVHMGGPNSLSTSVNDSFLFGPTFPAFSSNAAALRTSQDGGYFNPSPANHNNFTGLRNNSITSYRSNALSSYAVSPAGGGGGHIVSGQGRTLSRRRPRASSIVMLAHSKDFSGVGGGIMAPLGGVHSSLYRPRSRSVSRGGPCALSRSARQPSAHVSDAVDMLLQQVGGVGDDDESSPQESQLAASQFGSPQELLGFSLLEGKPINHHSRPNLSAGGKASSGVQLDEIFGFQSINATSSGSYETRVPMTHLDISGMGSGDGVGGLLAMPPQHSSLLVSPSRPTDRSNNMLSPNSTFIDSSGSINTNGGSGVFTPRARGGDDTCSPGISGNQFDSILQTTTQTTSAVPPPPTSTTTTQQSSVSPNGPTYTTTHNSGSVSAMTPRAWNVSTSRQKEKKRPQIHFLVDDSPPSSSPQ